MAHLKHLKRAFALGVLTALLLPAADAPKPQPLKPKIRAITAFITIDAKSYPAQIEEAVKFLNQIREAVKAAGYDAFLIGESLMRAERPGDALRALVEVPSTQYPVPSR